VYNLKQEDRNSVSIKKNKWLQLALIFTMRISCLNMFNHHTMIMS